MNNHNQKKHSYYRRLDLLETKKLQEVKKQLKKEAEKTFEHLKWLSGMWLEN